MYDLWRVSYKREIGLALGRAKIRLLLHLALRNSKSLRKLKNELYESGMAHLGELVHFTNYLGEAGSLRTVPKIRTFPHFPR